MKISFKLNNKQVEFECINLLSVQDLLYRSFELPSFSSENIYTSSYYYLLLLNYRVYSASLLLSCQLEDKSVLTSEGLSHFEFRPELERLLAKYSIAKCSYCYNSKLIYASSLIFQERGPNLEDLEHWRNSIPCPCASVVRTDSALIKSLKRIRQIYHAS